MIIPAFDFQEEEPSDDVLLSHVPLPKAKISVQMHDDEGPAQGHHESHNQPGQHTEQENAGNAGPMYQVVGHEDHNSAQKVRIFACQPSVCCPANMDIGAFDVGRITFLENEGT